MGRHRKPIFSIDVNRIDEYLNRDNPIQEADTLAKTINGMVAMDNVQSGIQDIVKATREKNFTSPNIHETQKGTILDVLSSTVDAPVIYDNIPDNIKQRLSQDKTLYDLPRGRELDPVTKNVLGTVLAPIESAVHGVRQGGTNIAEGVKKVLANTPNNPFADPRQLIEGTLQTTTGTVGAGFGAATPFVPVLSGFAVANKIGEAAGAGDLMSTIFSPFSKTLQDPLKEKVNQLRQAGMSDEEIANKLMMFKSKIKSISKDNTLKYGAELADLFYNLALFKKVNDFGKGFKEVQSKLSISDKGVGLDKLTDLKVRELLNPEKGQNIEGTKFVEPPKISDLIEIKTKKGVRYKSKKTGRFIPKEFTPKPQEGLTVEKSTITKEIKNAKQNKETTQPNGDVLKQKGQKESTGKVPANESSQRVSESGQKKEKVELPETSKAAIKNATERGKTPEQISEALKLPIEEVKKEVIKPAEQHIAETPREDLPAPISDKIKQQAEEKLAEIENAEKVSQPGFRRQENVSKGYETVRTQKPFTYSDFPEWFSQLGRNKKDVINALKKIIEDKGKDKGKLVEDVKSVILDHLKNGEEISTLVGTSGKFKRIKQGEVPPDAEIADFLNRFKSDVSKEDLLKAYKDYEAETSFPFGANAEKPHTRKIKQLEKQIASEKQAVFVNDKKVTQLQNEITKLKQQQAESESNLGLETKVVKKQKTAIPKEFDIEGASLSELKTFKKQLESLGTTEKNQKTLAKINNRIKAIETTGKQTGLFEQKQERLFSDENYKKDVNIIKKKPPTAGIDPTMIKAYTRAGAYHLENIIRSGVKRSTAQFNKWKNIMVDTFGKKIKPHLLKIWQGIKKEFGKKLAQIVEHPLFPIKQNRIIEGKLLTPEEFKSQFGENFSENPKTTAKERRTQRIDKTKVRGVSQRTKEKAIAKGLVDDIKDLPTYNVRKNAPQIEKASEMVANDFNKAKSIALGESTPPGDVLLGFIYKAAENKALKDKNYRLINDLAHSPVAKKFTEAGQLIQSLVETDPLSPVKAIKEVIKERETRYQKRVGKTKYAERKKNVKRQIKENIKKNNLNFPDWNSFINSIRCP